MKAQRERARNARSKELSMGVQSALLTDIKVESEYVGYEVLEAESELLVLIQDEAIVDSVSEGEVQAMLKWVDKLLIPEILSMAVDKWSLM